MMQFRPGSMSFVALACLAACVAAWAWATGVIPEYNSEIRGDIHHHALMVYEETLAESPWPGFFEGYPRLSHWLTAQLLPSFHEDPYKALRGLALASVLSMLAVQLALLCRAMPVRWAVVALLLWQWLCYETRTANLHFYHTSFFFSQGIGTVALWLALLVLVSPARRSAGRAAQTLLLAALANSAFFCHLVPGLVAWGMIALLALADTLRYRSWDRIACLLLLAAVGGLTVIGSGQFGYMKSSSSSDGTLWLRFVPLLCLWVPTLPIAAWQRIGAWRGGQPPAPCDRVLDGITALLVSAGLLQAACAWCWLVEGTMAPYAVKKLCLVTFPAAALYWTVVASDWLQQRLGKTASWARCRARLSPRGQRLLLALAVFGLAVRLVPAYVNTELRGPYATAATHPILISEQLNSRMKELNGCVYFDPNLKAASLFINMAGLGWDYGHANFPYDVNSGTDLVEQLSRRHGVEAVMLPPDVDPMVVFGVPVAGRRVGSWQCFALHDLAEALARQSQPAE